MSILPQRLGKGGPCRRVELRQRVSGTLYQALHHEASQGQSVGSRLLSAPGLPERQQGLEEVHHGILRPMPISRTRELP